MVSFTNISYSEAWKLGQKQEKIMREVMQTLILKKFGIMMK